MRRCLVTGAEGFVGLHLIRLLLQQGFFVRAWTRKESQLPFSCDTVHGELGAEDAPYASALNGIDTVFHLANTAHAKALSDCYKRDCELTLNLAQKAAESGVSSFVFVSSSKAVADPGSVIRDEEWDAWPTDAYGYWKRVAEQRLLAEINIPHVAILRPCLIYGVGVKGNLASMIKAINRGYFPSLPDTGARRSMVSVVDMAHALILAATHPLANRSPLIVSDGENYAVSSIYSTTRAALGLSRPLVQLPYWMLVSAGLVGDVAGLLWPDCPLSSAAVSRLTGSCEFSAAKLRGLGWKPTTTFYSELPAIVAKCLEPAGR